MYENIIKLSLIILSILIIITLLIKRFVYFQFRWNKPKIYKRIISTESELKDKIQINKKGLELSSPFCFFLIFILVCAIGLANIFILL